MPSPFPGMDPWLEDSEIFPDLRNRLIIHLSEVLNESLPQGYFATCVNRVWFDDESQPDPDVILYGEGNRLASTHWHATTGMMIAAGMIAITSETRPIIREDPYLEIRSKVDNRLVTAVMILTSYEKAPDKNARGIYQYKQGQFRLADVNLVEIDLLRGGRAYYCYFSGKTSTSCWHLRLSHQHDCCGDSRSVFR